LITNQRRTMGRIPYGGIDRLADDRWRRQRWSLFKNRSHNKDCFSRNKHDLFHKTPVYGAFFPTQIFAKQICKTQVRSLYDKLSVKLYCQLQCSRCWPLVVPPKWRQLTENSAKISQMYIYRNYIFGPGSRNETVRYVFMQIFKTRTLIDSLPILRNIFSVSFFNCASLSLPNIHFRLYTSTKFHIGAREV
jgi:hypothetical protein